MFHEEDMAMGSNKASVIESLIQALSLLMFFAVLAVLSGCDNAEFDRQVHRAQINEAFRSQCLPYGDEKVIVQWRDGLLICGRANNLNRRAGNTPAIVAHAEEVNQ